MGGINTLIGKITQVLSPVFPNRWELNGNVVVTDSAGNIVSGRPGMVSGEGAVPVVPKP
jgi:hypothetical protein